LKNTSKSPVFAEDIGTIAVSYSRDSTSGGSFSSTFWSSNHQIAVSYGIQQKFSSWRLPFCEKYNVPSCQVGDYPILNNNLLEHVMWRYAFSSFTVEICYSEN